MAGISPQYVAGSFDNQTGAITFTPTTASVSRTLTVLENAAEHLYSPGELDPAFDTLTNAQKLAIIADHFENQMLAHARRMVEDRQETINQTALDTAITEGAELS